ncbi:MAG: 2-C-methyl-D-erythritol 4-phosphate cytidylyltransferase [Micrococcaceae bacterium]
MSEKIAVIITAAGNGTRLAQSLPKAAVAINGRSIIERAIDTVLQLPELSQLVITVPCEDQHITPLIPQHDAISIVTGGATRQESVCEAVKVIKNADYVLVHDAARCFTPLAVYTRVVAKLKQGHEAVIPVMPVVDTIKKVEGDIVVEEIDRNTLASVQTPQGFTTQALVQAHQKTKLQASDDATLASLAGYQVHTVAGDYRALKITYPLDVKVAESL